MSRNTIRYSDSVCYGTKIIYREDMPLPKRWNPNEEIIPVTPKETHWIEHYDCECWNYYLKRKAYYDFHLNPDNAEHWVFWNLIYPEMFPSLFMLNIEKQNRRINNGRLSTKTNC